MFAVADDAIMLSVGSCESLFVRYAVVLAKSLLVFGYKQFFQGSIARFPYGVQPSIYG